MKGLYHLKILGSFLKERLPLAPRLGQRLVQVPLSLDHPYWVDDPDFDIDMHLHHTALPDSGDCDNYESWLLESLAKNWIAIDLYGVYFC